MLKTSTIFETKNQYINNRRKDLFRKLTFFKDEIYDPLNVFYPCCCDDITPAYAFTNSNVTFLDKDRTLYDVMNEHEVKFILGDVNDYTPKIKNDLILILNSKMRSKPLVRSLDTPGYVLSNDYHNNASELLRDKEFEFLGLINRDKIGELYLAEDKTVKSKFGDYLHVFQKIN